ncbi:GPI ethanolamine phosphate transferase 2-like isoform X1 [Anthonomus grandis grandis]|uniref:GPI ethanolamine phosphate transferase 2-like isoform X1 n=1 Tax=Anthonomus grandis grandis TaxID=2921223 RepID=UPI002166268E|nr:GPI ethanolamine phosphate transferase 2-like isoform X1 [Anthonomus grandis grandis]
MFLYALLLLLTVVLYLQGFFPMSNPITAFNNDPPTHIGNISINTTAVYSPLVQKTVLIIIDALRYDFVTPDLMPHTMGLVTSQGCLNKVIAESPTVTLPRIKALTTGCVPQYIDVIQNLASSEALKDSWLHSAKKKGLKIVFYGDNTWEKLFPRFFDRSEGTTSFFVRDFTEVDNNVTRNVNIELEKNDWDIMILHYLGLDHIGHVLGPFSSRIKPKLQEMDLVIDQIYQKIKNVDSIIMITGDHGMRDSGGHGGSSHPEITVPFVSIGRHCKSSIFKQTDIPSNLAALLGINIPTTSTGTIQKDLLYYQNTAKELYILRYNTEILLRKCQICQTQFDEATSLHEEYLKEGNITKGKQCMRIYQECSKKITGHLYENSSRQDMSALLIAIFVLCNLVLIILFNLIPDAKIRFVELFLCLVIIFSKIILEFSHIITAASLIILILILFHKFKLLHQLTLLLQTTDRISLFLLIIHIMHPVTFMSTSYIEEEHFIWIFYSVTLILMLFFDTLKTSRLIATKGIFVLLALRFSMTLNSTVENSVQDKSNLGNILVKEENYLYHQLFFAFNLILVFLFMNFGQECVSYYHPSHILSGIILAFIFLLKSLTFHSTILGKLIWMFILTKKLIFTKQTPWTQLFILAGALLFRSHNIILIPIAICTGYFINMSQTWQTQFSKILAFNTIANSLYFLQGHRNSLATVDISAGYTGLSEYNPVLVTSQVILHTYLFHILFHLAVLSGYEDTKKRKQFWTILILLRCYVIFLTCVVMLIFKDHLFIWSVFAPKFFIESVHTGFLFVEICIYYFCKIVSYCMKT